MNGVLMSRYQDQINNLLDSYQNGRLVDAENLAVSLTKEFPNHNFSWKILGAIFKATGRFAESIKANQTAVALNPKDAGAHSNLGVILQEQGKLDESEESCKQAIILKPDFAEAYYNLGITLIELGKIKEAEESYIKATTLKPDFAEAHYNLANTFIKLGRLDQAELSYRKAIALKPNFDKAHNKLLRCLYQADKQSLFFEELDYLLNQEEVNATIGSFTCRSELKYGIKKQNLFCNEPLKYISHIDLNTKYDFEEIFIRSAKSILNKHKISNRNQYLLLNGNQTSGNLFNIQTDITGEIQKTIRKEIENYRFYFKDSNEGLIKKWPAKYNLYGWIISMKSGGELKPHIHDKGWLSGSAYINVPPKSNTDCGNLVVSLGEEKDAINNRINTKKTIDVVTGSLVLFPSSLTHYTVPFESKENRIVLAFDVVPK